MRDRVELAAGRVIRKYDPRERLAVEGTALSDHSWTEDANDLLESGRSRCDDLPRQEVGIDHGKGARPKSSRDRAFPRCNSAREPEDVHLTAMFYNSLGWERARVDPSRAARA